MPPYSPTQRDPPRPPPRVFQKPVLLNVWSLCGSQWGHFGHGVPMNTPYWWSPFRQIPQGDPLGPLPTPDP